MNNDYNLVTTNEDGETEGLVCDVASKLGVDDEEQDDGAVIVLGHPQDDGNDDDDDRLFGDVLTMPTLVYWLHCTLLPDQPVYYRGMKLVDSPGVVKFTKFLAATALLLVGMFHLVRAMDWEHNYDLRLADLYTYESNLIIQDAMVYFVVGRLYQQRGVDHMTWIIFCVAANVFASVLTRFRFLQHAFTLYEMHCRWPWQLFVFVLLATPIVVGVILLHVHRAVRQGLFGVKLLELVGCLLLFLLPYLPSKYLHMHHWYIGWLVGMHFNVDAWWSRAAMAWCWGLYINGIAAYGRDPVLTCGYSYWLSEHMQCPYLQCYVEELVHPTMTNDTHHVAHMEPPDWRNCSADAYHP